MKLLNGKNDICAALKDLKIKAVAPRRHYLGQKWLDIFFFPHFCPPFLAVSILMGFNFHIKQLEFTHIRASIFSWKWSITASKQVCFSFAWNCLRRRFVVLELSWMKTPGQVLPPHHPPLEASSIKKVRLNVMPFRKRKEKKSFGRNEQVGGQTCLYNQWMTHGHPQWQLCCWHKVKYIFLYHSTNKRN